MSYRPSMIAHFVAIGFLLFSAAGRADSYRFSMLTEFNGPTTGSNPNVMTIGADGNFYGTTYSGGPLGAGTVFRVDKDSYALTSLTSFTNNFARYPSKLTLGGDGNFIGTTQTGGPNVAGTVFQYSPTTNSINQIATFNGTTNGKQPSVMTMDANGNIYGATTSGGTNNVGTIYKIAAGTNVISTIASLDVSHGRSIAGLIVDPNGNIFGTASTGGTYNAGTLFEIAAGTNTFSTLATFGYANGSYPGLIVMDSNGNIFGTTSSDGLSSDPNLNDARGTIFEFSATTQSLSILQTFHGANNIVPYGLTFDADGNMFGTTRVGGDYGYGSVFEIAAGTNTVSTLYSFDHVHGDLPTISFIDSAGNIFGTTYRGGVTDEGTIFMLRRVPEASSVCLTAFAFAAFVIPCMRRLRQAST